MWVENIKNKRGSTLIMVLMTFSILSILGLGLLSLSVINMKLKIADKNEKISLYLAEAGLEEAYAKVEKTTRTAIDIGVENVKTELELFIAGERAKDKETRAARGYIRSDGSVNMDKIKADDYLNRWFRKGYATKFNEVYAKNDSNELNTTDYTVLDTTIDDKKPIVKVIDIDTFDTSNLTKDSKLTITLSSVFTHKNMTRNIKSIFAVSIPPYDSPYSVENSVLKENMLWTKALIADKDIVVKGKDVSVNGDIYAYGVGSSDADKKSHGIVVGSGSSGKLSVTGNVVTNSYLTTRAKNSSIDISGEVFCHSLTVSELDNEENENLPDNHDENCSVTVNGNVNTKDDIKLNGEHSKIQINGNYYGFSEGLEGYDKSSSIMLNSDDVKESSLNKSKIIITGDGKPKSYYADSVGSFIAGTVYVNLATNYQSGESISVKGNYKAYTKEIKTSQINKSTSTNPFEITLEDLSYSLKKSLGLLDDLGNIKPSVTFPINNPYAVNNVNFEYNDPIYMANSFKTAPFGASEKADYFYQAYKEDKQDPSNASDPLINLGDEAIDVRNIKASTGVYLSKNTGASNNDLQRQTFVSTTQRDIYTKINNEYNYNVNAYGDSQKTLDVGVDNYSTKSNAIEEDFNFTTNINSYVGGEINYSNNDAGKSLFIIGPKSGSVAVGDFSSETKPADDIINLTNSSVNGIIVTRGDVYIYGSLNYNGIIVTKGNIYFYDDNPKVVTNNYKASKDIETNYGVKKVVADLNTEGTQIGDLFTQNSNWKVEIGNLGYVSTIAVDTQTKTYYKLSKLINVSGWSKIYNN